MDASVPFACFHVRDFAAFPDGWLSFARPSEIQLATNARELVGLLRLVDEAWDHGSWALLFLSHEAAPALFDKYQTKSPNGFPLAGFARFDSGPVWAPHLPPGLPPPPLHLIPEIDRNSYTESIQKIRALIAEGSTYQVNFTFRLRGQPLPNPWGFFCHVATTHPTPHAVWLCLPSRIVLSFSPELFFERRGRWIQCRPMKGTTRRGRWSEEDEASKAALACSPKNRAENVMIVDMVRHDLGQIANPGSVRVASLFEVETYRTVHQMTSTVVAETNAPMSEVLRALFPPASVTGAPKVRTLRIIADLEPSPRGLYCGTLGLLAPGQQAIFNVAIRTLVQHEDLGCCEYGVGGGIVWDSDPASEYDEALSKALILSTVEPPFALLETMRCGRNGKPRLWSEHFARLSRSARYFGFPPPDEAELLKRIGDHVRAAGAGPLRIRLRYDDTGNAALESEPLPITRATAPQRLVLDDQPICSEDLWCYHKTTRRRRYEEARRRHPDADDVILWNERGEVTETTTANIAVWIGGRWVTPPLSAGLLPGTMRGKLLRRGMLAEAPVMLADIRRAKRILVFNSVRGLQYGRLESEP